MKEALSLTRKEITEATSLAWPNLFIGILFLNDSNKAGLLSFVCWWNGVSIVPGATPLTRMLYLTNSLAKALVKVIIAPLAVA